MPVGIARLSGHAHPGAAVRGGVVMLGVIPCHGGKGMAAVMKDTGRFAEAVLEAYSARDIAIERCAFG